MTFRAFISHYGKRFARRLRPVALFMLRPFVTHLPVFVLFLCLGLVNVFVFVALSQSSTEIFDASRVCYRLSAAWVAAYLYTLIYSAWPRWYTLLPFLIYAGVGALVEIVSFSAISCPYSRWLLGVVMGTNAQEAGECIDQYLNFVVVFKILAFITVIVGSFYLTRCLVRRRRLLRYWWCILASVATVLAIYDYILIFTIDTYVARQSYTPYNFFYDILHAERLPDIVPANPRLEFTTDERPQNVVIIFGESLRRANCHFSGYSKPTTPHLDSLVSAGRLSVFNYVTTPQTHTIQTFQCIMSTNMFAGEGNTNWNTAPNIIEVARLSGYRTVWLSNQSRAGVADNLITKFAEFCDEYTWTSKNQLISPKTPLPSDDALLPLIAQDIAANKQVPTAYFIHLMGSHVAFDSRYPESFRHFSPSEYAQFPEHQRNNRASYDNTVLFNDYVVSEIMRLFDGTPTIVLYFSDHGLDIYDSSSYYCGHAKRGNSKSEYHAWRIPFVVYTTPEYEQAFPDMCRRIDMARNRAFSTNNLIYAVMDIIGVRFADNNDVASRSLFR